MPVREDAWRRMLTTEALSVQRGKCIYCKAPLPRRRATADHKHPRSRGGTTERNNIAAACAGCNQAKAAMSEARFIALINGKRPPAVSIHLMLVWASRRIWKRTHLAYERIERLTT